MCLQSPLPSTADSFSRTRVGNSPTSTSSYTSSTENCPHLPLIPLTRSWIEMSRTYSLDEMATPRDPSQEPREKEPGQPRDAEGQNQGRSGGAESQPRPNTPQEVRKPEARAVEPRKPYECRNRTYALRSSEIQTMTDIAKFSGVDAKDLR